MRKRCGLAQMNGTKTPKSSTGNLSDRCITCHGINQQAVGQTCKKHRYAEQSRMKRRNGGILVSYPGEFLEYEQRLLIPPFFPLFFYILPIHISCQFIPAFKGFGALSFRFFWAICQMLDTEQTCPSTHNVHT